MTPAQLLEILENLPSVQLELLSLLKELVDDDGHLDQQKISFHYAEVEKAAAQAEEYAKGTKELVGCLSQLLR